MTTPWPPPTHGATAAGAASADGTPAGAGTVGTAGAADADAPPPSTAAGYADAARRDATERAARAALAAAARTARDRVGDMQRRGVDAGRMAEAARIEAVLGRLNRVIDRLSSPTKSGPWFAAKALPADAAAWLADADRRLSLALGELATTAAGGDPTAADVQACDGVVGDAAALLDGRRDALAARDWTPRAVQTGLAAVAPGEQVSDDGRFQRVVEVARFARGDVGVSLADGLVLWEDRDGRRITFEAAAAGAPDWPPPPVLELADDTFRAAWSDDGAAVVRGPAGRRSVAAPRAFMAGDAGGWLWLAVARPGDGPAAWRGVGVEADAGDGQRVIPGAE